MRGFRSAVAVFSVFVAGLGLAGSASAAFSDVPTSTVTGPVPVTANSYPYLATDIDLEEYGYVEQEFFLEGQGYRYNTPLVDSDTNADKILTGGSGNDGLYPFKTRIVVRRPANPADANGVVVAEWNNVTSTQDVEFNWFGDPYFLLKNGYTFVGVTAQTTGVNSLKAFDNARYGSLGLAADPSPGVGSPGDPGYVPADSDPLSYDVFSSVVKALKGGRTGVDPLGGIVPTKVIASGESQSCGRLSTHYNKIQPTHEIVDAYLLTVCTAPLRTDRPEKAIRIITESENRVPRSEATLPDTGSIRHWEVAAASHLPRVAFDNLNGVFTRDFAAVTADCTKFPLSRVKWPYTQNVAIRDLVSWSDGGAAPPIAPRGEYLPDNSLARDEYGIAKGGIRYPDVTVPTAVNDGINSAAPGGSLFSAFCGLFGSSTPFSSELLHELYGEFDDYLGEYLDATDSLVDSGFLLPEDRGRLIQDALNFARLRPSPYPPGATETIQTVRSSMRIGWTGTIAPDTTFDVQRASAKGPGAWKTIVPLKATYGRAKLGRQPEGTFFYRVRSKTILPGTNISAPETVVTPYSDPQIWKVDRTGPQTPKIVLKGRKVRAMFRGKKRLVYRGKVRVKVIGKPDRRLPDGTVGVGLNKKSVPKIPVIKRPGKTVIKVRTRDKLRNTSKVARVVVRIKR